MSKVWNLRVFERRKPGQRKDPSYVTVAHGPEEVTQALANLLHHEQVTRVDITPKGSAPEPATAPKPVKARPLEWEQDAAWTKGERWFGKVNGKLIATVTHNTMSTSQPFDYSLHLGAPEPEYVKVSNIESGKRAAQAAFAKVVRQLVE